MSTKTPDPVLLAYLRTVVEVSKRVPVTVPLPELPKPPHYDAWLKRQDYAL
jgi:hypothetical protein